MIRYTQKKTVNVCQKCYRPLSEAEVYFYGNKCTECVYQELIKDKQ